VPRSTPKSCSIRANSASFFRSASLPADDAPVRGAAIDVLPDLLGELRLLLHLLEHGHVGLDAAHPPGSRSRPKCLLPAHARENRRATGRNRVGAAASAACGATRRAVRAEAGLQDGAAGRGLQRIRLFHRASLARGPRAPKVMTPRAATHPANLWRFWTTSAAPRTWVLAGDPGRQPPLHGPGVTPAFGRARVCRAASPSMCNTRPMDRVRGLPDGAVAFQGFG